MLNETELLVLNAALAVIQDETGGQFGFTSDVLVPHMTRRTVAGYLSQLSQKGMLRVHADDGTVQATRLGVETAGNEEWFEF